MSLNVPQKRLLWDHRLVQRPISLVQSLVHLQLMWVRSGCVSPRSI